MAKCVNGHITSGNYCIICESGKTEKKPVKKIPKVSTKEVERLKKYNIARTEFLAKPENANCRVYPHLKATQVHHKKGRTGSLLWDQRFFLAVSHQGHVFIHENVEWAKEKGFILTRLDQ
jgi:hypothetical protein